jgi:hypothetical protein
MAKPLSPGQVAYAAYAEDYWPSHCPPYERLGRDEQRAWEAAAQAVRDAFLSSAQLSPLPQEEEDA